MRLLVVDVIRLESRTESRKFVCFSPSLESAPVDACLCVCVCMGKSLNPFKAKFIYISVFNTHSNRNPQKNETNAGLVRELVCW